MNIKRAGKQTKACWRSERKWEEIWTSHHHDHTTVMLMLQGHATGWIAGVAWAKKQLKADAK